MGSEWPTKTFENGPLEILDGDRGKNYPNRKEFTDHGHCVFLNTGNVTTDGFKFESIDFISEERDHLLRKGKLKREDVVLTTRGTVGNAAYFDDKIPFDHIRINSGMVLLRSSPEDLEPRFLYLFVRSHLFSEQVASLTSGSAQPQLPIRDIKRIEIPLPPLPEQKAIAHILGTLDDKIELNRRMNATLEGMAQALFKSWFVDFDPVIDNALAAGNPIPDELAARAEVRRQALANGTANREAAKAFPDSFQETESMGWIPEGWEVRAIGDSFQLLGGHSFKSGDYVEDGRFGIVTIKNVQDGSFVQECTNRITEIPGKMKSHCHLNSGDVLLSLTGNVGRVCVVSEGDFLLNQRVSKIVGRDGIPEAFGYFFFRQETLYERMITIAKGTAQQNLSPIETAKLEQAMPCNQTIVELGEHLREFHVKMVGNTSQSQTLTKLRDTLLPKLISGELRIPEAEQLTEEALA